MNRELQALVERMIEAERVAFFAKRAFAEAEATANRLEVAATSAETERNRAKIALNQMIIGLASNPPAIARTPEPIDYNPDEESEIVDPHGVTHKPYDGPCDSCCTRVDVTQREGFGIFPTFCPMCWAIAFKGGPDVCNHCFGEVTDNDRGNSYVAEGECARCNNYPCGHCGLEGGH